MRIGVAISGGMDSATAALLLQNEGHDIVALYMKLVEDSEIAIAKAQKVAGLIKRPLHVIDLVKDFRKVVLDHFVNEYEVGRTPSPCPRCNRFIKFDILGKHAREMGCEKIATGHYAQIVEKDGRLNLVKARDTIKDQSYFLFMLTHKILERTIFPLGVWEKTQVRSFLKDIDLPLSQSKESQELCFIENDDYVGFLQKMGCRSAPGPITDSHGNILGEHRGIVNFTVGQRRGLGVCGPYPRYVLRIDHKTNSIMIGFKDETPVKGATISDLNIIRPDLDLPDHALHVKVRSTSQPVPCRVNNISRDQLDFEFFKPQSSVAPGQAAVFYMEDTVVMGGWIKATF